MGDEYDRTITMLKAAVGLGNRVSFKLNRSAYTLEVRKVFADFSGGPVADVPVLFAVPADYSSRGEGTAIDWPTRDGTRATKITSRFSEYDDWGSQVRHQGDYNYVRIDGATYWDVAETSPSSKRALIAAAATAIVQNIVAVHRAVLAPYADALALSPLPGGKRVAEMVEERFPSDVATLTIEQATDAAVELRQGIVEDLKKAVIAEAGRIAVHLRAAFIDDDALYSQARAQGYDIGLVEARISPRPGPRSAKPGASRVVSATVVTRHGQPLEPAPFDDAGQVDGWPPMTVDTAITVIKETAEIWATRQRQRGTPDAGLI